MRAVLVSLSPFALTTAGFFGYKARLADYKVAYESDAMRQSNLTDTLLSAQDTPLEESTVYMAAKCAPILALMLFVALQAFGPYRLTKDKEFNRYCKRIMAGLLLCAVGDALLVYEMYFLPGLVAFALGHCAYIYSFGFHPNLHISSGAIVGTIAMLAYIYIFSSLKENGVLTVAVAVYCALIGAMVWRAVARCVHKPNPLRYVAVFGAITFAVSDMTLAINRFVRPLEGAGTVVMVTYYVAQLAISVSVIESTFVFRSSCDMPATASTKKSKKTSKGDISYGCAFTNNSMIRRAL